MNKENVMSSGFPIRGAATSPGEIMKSAHLKDVTKILYKAV